MIELLSIARARLFGATAPVVAAALCLLLALQIAGAPEARADEMSQEEFEARVRDYLLANPEVILESVQRLQEHQEAAAQAAAWEAVSERTDQIQNDPNSPV